MEDNSLQPNCTQCKYHTFKKCLKGSNGEMLEPREVEQENIGCDEYDCCSGWEAA